MDRYQCSYWLVVKPHTEDRTIKPADKARLESVVAERFYGNLVPACHDEHMLLFEVIPEQGTVEQMTDAFDTFKDIAIGNAEYDFLLDEINEEDKSRQHRMVIREGKLVADRYSRLVPCSMQFDKATVDAIAKHVNPLNPVIAAIIHKVFDPLCEPAEMG